MDTFNVVVTTLHKTEAVLEGYGRWPDTTWSTMYDNVLGIEHAPGGRLVLRWADKPTKPIDNWVRYVVMPQEAHNEIEAANLRAVGAGWILGDED